MYYVIEYKRLGEWEHANTRKTFEEASRIALNAIEGGRCYDGIRILDVGGNVVAEWSSTPLPPITTSSPIPIPIVRTKETSNEDT